LPELAALLPQLVFPLHGIYTHIYDDSEVGSHDEQHECNQEPSQVETQVTVAGYVGQEDKVIADEYKDSLVSQFKHGSKIYVMRHDQTQVTYVD